MKVTPFALVVAVFLMIGVSGVSAASQNSFSAASSNVQSAFVAVQTAGRDGGNITSLVAQLNGALVLIRKAAAENASNPVQASADLQSALSIAQGVQSSAPAVAQMGRASRQMTVLISTETAYAIIFSAVLIYIFGDRIYHRLWLRMYRGHVVKKVG